MALSLTDRPVYLATAHIWDDEFRQRVSRHQQRRGPQWTNIEEEKYLSRHDVTGRVVVVDCITLWCTNFFFKQGVSLTIDDEKKPGLYKKMRNVLKNTDNVWAMIGATIVLAAGVSLVEFSCTAAFPVIWSNILSAHGVTKLEFALHLLLYMLLYQGAAAFKLWTGQDMPVPMIKERYFRR